jgi:hypothetical protein
MARPRLRACWRALLLAGCLGLQLLHPALSQDPLAKYALDWATVPNATADIAPRSITGACACKAAAGACTPNCCCDPDCPPALLQQYAAEGACLPEGSPPDQLQYCTAADTIAKVSGPPATAFAAVLCCVVLCCAVL